MSPTSIEKNEDFIPIGEPDISDLEIQAATEVLRKGWLTRGSECLELEREFGEYVGADYALAVNSCTAALHLALLAHGIGSGDEVILPSLTFAATGHAVVHCGAKPVFAEISPETYCINPAHVEALITPATRAIMPVHYAGHPADLEALRGIAAKHDLAIIEDAAHALAASYESRRIGGAESCACLSFYTNKNITTADGGILTMPSAELHEKAQRLSLHGMGKDAWKRFGAGSSWQYEVSEFGFKYNFNDLQAAIARAQLSRLEGMQQRRRRVWKFYNEMFVDEERLILPPERPNIEHAHLMYVLRLAGAAESHRNTVVDALRDKGIGATVHYYPLHLHKAYRERFGTCEGMLPVTELAASQILSMPISSRMTDMQTNRAATELLRIA